MKLSKRIRLISENITKRDIYFFRKDLNAFKNLIYKMRQANPNASITDCIEGYNTALETLILETNVLRPGEIYRYIAADTLLDSRNCNSIIHEINSSIDFEDTNLLFTGNLYHDYIFLIKTYYYKKYVLELGQLTKYSRNFPYDNTVKIEINNLQDQLAKLKKGNLSPYDISKIQKEQKEFLEMLRKKEKINLSEKLSNHIWLKIDFLRQIGALSNYEDEYNKTLEKLSMPSSFRITDRKKFEEELLDKNKLRGYSISELIALNAFWTNRLVKEVERRNEVIYVLENTNNFYAFSEGKEFDLIDEDIIYYLAEYRAIVPYITKFKLDGRKKNKEKTFDEQANIAVMDFDIREIFSRDDIEYYGYRDLDAMSYNVLLLNNRSQLLYDQKDIAIGEMVSLMVNSKGYYNAGISLEDDGTRYKEKSLLAIDLKGFNAPLMLHIDKDVLMQRIKKTSGKIEIPVYRGGRDFIIESSQGGKKIAKTNVLFKLNSTQRKDIAARAGVVGARDTNGRYVTHISWMLNPKKDMPQLIREPRRIMDLETGEIEELEENNERKK